MAVRSVFKGRSLSKFDLGDRVKTPSGLVGEVIGMVEYAWGWEYRIKVPGKAKTMYRRERMLKLVERGTRERRAHWTRMGHSKGKISR